MKNLLSLIAATGVVLFLNLSSLQACSVCFGGADSDLVKGFTWGIWILLILPFLLIGTLVGLIVYSIRKNKRHA